MIKQIKRPRHRLRRCVRLLKMYHDLRPHCVHHRVPTVPHHDHSHSQIHPDYHRLTDEFLQNPNSVRKKLNRESSCSEFDPPIR